ncbi:glutathione S-transferase family protein [Alteromonas sp. 5E99-2]|uniref:glutathione S-transferase family protein n=1 Tax=Alteromonas sp. 5E99-2 TaxID=2817683 RepID=UPI001A983E28|nr:glutathione S-transferase family protein [Alteromonas sp. 5E99-2]MBO1254488.1 glutathione S-transferase family protein [Alteromonas sp. 5E99-2]
MKLYDFPLSGHAHRARAMLSLLNVDYDHHVMDLANGEHKTPEFLAINPLGQVPTLTDGDVVLRDSTAILTYLALKYDDKRQWLPEDPALAALVQSWLSVSVHEVFDGPCVSRLIKLFGYQADHAQAVEKAHTVFTTLFEPHFENNEWLVGNAPTIADIANYSYIARVNEGEVSLENYPNIRAWLVRVESLDGFEQMPHAADA